MPKYLMRVEDSGNVYTLNCPEEMLLERMVGKGPLKMGSKFRRISKLDDSVVLETLVGLPKKNPNARFSDFAAKAWNDAQGINPEQIPEALAADRALGLNTEYHPQTGQVRFPDRKTRKRFMESHGFYDLNCVGGIDPQRLDSREREIRAVHGSMK